MQSQAESLSSLIRRNADEVNRLHARIHETLEEREKSADKRQQWQQA